MKKMEFEQFYNLENIKIYSDIKPEGHIFHTENELGITLKISDYRKFFYENPSLVSDQPIENDNEQFKVLDDKCFSDTFWYDEVGIEYYVYGFKTEVVYCQKDVIIIPFDDNCCADDAKIRYTKLFNLLKDNYGATFSMVVTRHECKF